MDFQDLKFYVHNNIKLSLTAINIHNSFYDLKALNP